MAHGKININTLICNSYDLQWQLLVENIICPLGFLPFYCSNYSHIITSAKGTKIFFWDKYAKMFTYLISLAVYVYILSIGDCRALLFLKTLLK